MKVAAIIQARMGSTRYPGKVLETISNHPVLYHVIERIRDSQYIDVIVVATTTDHEDRILLKRAREFQVREFAGAQHDLVKRFMGASQLVDADIIVRIPCDNPLFEPSFIDDCVSMLEKEKADYCYVKDAVLGTGVDVFTRDALKRVDEEAAEPHYREHIITYFKDNPDKFKIATLTAHERYKLPTLRLTFDTKEDLKLIRMLYHKFYHEESIVSLVKVISFLRQNPEAAGLNAEVIQKAAEESELAAKAKAEAEAAAAAAALAAREMSEASEEISPEHEPEPVEEPPEEHEGLVVPIAEGEPAEAVAEQGEEPNPFLIEDEPAKETQEKNPLWESLFRDEEQKEDVAEEPAGDESDEKTTTEDEGQKEDTGEEETGDEPEKETPQ
jgi:spore coat polysaccharide biosynthesis protein SpsF